MDRLGLKGFLHHIHLESYGTFCADNSETAILVEAYGLLAPHIDVEADAPAAMLSGKLLHEQHVVLAYASPFKLGVGGYLPHKKAVAFGGFHLEGACKRILGGILCNNDVFGVAVSAYSPLAIRRNPVEQEMAGHLYATSEEYPMDGAYQLLVGRLYKYVTFLRIHNSIGIQVFVLEDGRYGLEKYSHVQGKADIVCIPCVLEPFLPD